MPLRDDNMPCLMCTTQSYLTGQRVQQWMQADADERMQELTEARMQMSKDVQGLRETQTQLAAAQAEVSHQTANHMCHGKPDIGGCRGQGLQLCIFGHRLQ